MIIKLYQAYGFIECYESVNINLMAWRKNDFIIDIIIKEICCIFKDYDEITNRRDFDPDYSWIMRNV